MPERPRDTPAGVRIPRRMDVSESWAKLKRAREHFEALEAQMAVIGEHHPVALRVTDVDPDTGWCEVHGHWALLKEPSVAVIAGDYIHNLRSALDYTITGLVRASGARLTDSHQFPIFSDGAKYRERAGSPSEPKGPLKGIGNVAALEFIERMQPFNDERGADESPLADINRFSNTDKHRQTLVLAGIPLNRFALELDAEGREPLEQWQSGSIPIGEEAKIAAFRFAEPYPNVRMVRAQAEAIAGFADYAFPPRYPDGALVSMQVLRGLAGTVTLIVAKLSRAGR